MSNIIKVGFILTLTILNRCIIPNPETIKYDVWGHVYDHNNKSLIDHLTIERNIISNHLEPWGSVSSQPIWSSDSGLYGCNYRAWEKDKSGSEMLNESVFSFKILSPGHITLDTAFEGRELKREIDYYGHFTVFLPDIFLNKE